MKKEKMVLKSVRMPLWVWNQLKMVAAATSTSISSMVRIGALEQAKKVLTLEKEKHGKPNT